MSASSDLSLAISVEYAKTGRAKCHRCKNPISQGSIRMGKQYCADHEGEFKYHLKCFRVPTGKGTAEECLFGYEKLREADRIKVSKIWEEKGGASGTVTQNSTPAATGKAGTGTGTSGPAAATTQLSASTPSPFTSQTPATPVAKVNLAFQPVEASPSAWSVAKTGSPLDANTIRTSAPAACYGTHHTGPVTPDNLAPGTKFEVSPAASPFVANQPAQRKLDFSDSYSAPAPPPKAPLNNRIGNYIGLSMLTEEQANWITNVAPSVPEANRIIDAATEMYECDGDREEFIDTIHMVVSTYMNR